MHQPKYKEWLDNIADVQYINIFMLGLAACISRQPRCLPLQQGFWPQACGCFLIVDVVIYVGFKNYITRSTNKYYLYRHRNRSGRKIP